MADNDLGVFRVGDSVWSRGRFSGLYSVRGTIENVEREGDTLEGVRYGIRLENGNFTHCDWSQVKARSR
jgi:hypothetical protein